MATSSDSRPPLEGDSRQSMDLSQLQSWLKFVENDALMHTDPIQIHNGSPVVEPATSPDRITPPQAYIEDWPEIKVKLDNTIVPRIRSGKMLPLIGGTPITQQHAMELRKVIYGSSVHSFSKDWKRASFIFNSNDSPFPYGLFAERNGSRGILMAVQGFIIKHLIFKHERSESFDSSLLKPSSWHCKDSLIKSMSEMLWMAGDKKCCTVSLPQETALFGPTTQYRSDGITERLHLFEFQKYEDLERFIKRYLSYFEQGDQCGVILFLYSMVLSRTVARCQSDYGEGDLQLLTDYEECTQALVNLLLTGRAVRYLHNGSNVYSEDGQALTQPQAGIKERNSVGFLFWHREEKDRKRTQVGSMLKTPRRPIWVTLVNGQFGLLFSTNPDLISDWRVEHRFVLHYYTGLSTQRQAVRLNVDTRFGQKSRSVFAKKEEEKKIPALQQCIMTKWYGADINWNGVMPFV